MTGFTRQTAWTSVMIGAGVVMGLAGLAQAQTTAPAAEASTTRGPQQAKIKGDNVYVRSGSHQNYYPVTKLNRGDPVTVVGSQYGWMEILPPSGTFSLIDKTYVDRSDDTGTVNEACWVYAGSNLDDRRYAKQVKLKRGDKVHILGESPDGAFYKIEPPEGAHLWVKGDFVEGATVADSTPAPKEPERVAPGELKLPGDEPLTREESPSVTRDLADQSEGSGIVVRSSGRQPSARRTVRKEKPGPVKATEKYQLQIDAIEAEMTAIRGKPGNEEGYRKIVSKLQPIADQREDEIASLYATARIKQIQAYLDAQEGLRRIDRLREEAIANADRLAAERARIPKPRPVIPGDEIVVKGEIRVSTIYEGTGGRAKRWRIVEQGAGVSARTLAYIELPPGSPINPVDYYGKYVGIRASARQVLSDANPPIPIYTVSEIVVLDADSRSPGRVGGSTAYASPTGPSVAPPASQPADVDADEQ
ncbi:MAG TPA: hypothetical protein PKG54_01740 [Phycisphaerae bacterium]|jgi:uncharacterized protein YgiM (DUF1202 family)|nr:hypothetical protein [Phycisphaerae bacterium]HOB73223.1 hypothetical protein [Phycisphaerae bacterium]HOJ54857.1 hypothetical protein [Phycisphaerae bacterium]HOL26043.1 hypothetical protein [Phycisphaerae bacterium]HPP21497.1 hypothetical protein [Phycisphaerae bacterium]